MSSTSVNGGRPELGATRVAGNSGRVGAGPEGASPSPYDRPVITQPVWTWEIPTYFYTGGLAGASAGLALLADLRGNEVVARRGWRVALVGSLASPALLTSDLGRPERFLYMLRVFKVTSPMSVGSWLLAAFGAATGAGWLDRELGGRLPGGRAARAAAAVFGLPLSSYTAALVANTAVPAWHESRRLLPFLFVSGAATSAGGALTAICPPRDAAPARRLAVMGAVAELALKEVMERRLGSLGDAYKEGKAHRFGTGAKAAVAAGSAAIALGGRRSHTAAVAGGMLLSVGALAARWSVFEAGVQSAANPRHTVEPQRERIDAGASPGASTRRPDAHAPAGHGSPGRSTAVEAGRPASEAAEG